MITVGLLVPAEQVALLRKAEGPRRRQFDSCALLDFSSEPVQPAFCQDVFQASMFAICAITEVAMNRDDGLGYRLQVIGCYETDYVGQARESLDIAVRHAHAASGEQVVSNQFIALANCDESK